MKKVLFAEVNHKLIGGEGVQKSNLSIINKALSQQMVDF